MNHFSLLRIRRVLVLLFAIANMMILGVIAPAWAHPSQQADTALLAPVSAGQQLTVIHGYNDPLPGETCIIGNASDHCRNQQFALDLVPSEQNNRDILAPLPGQIAWIAGNCLGIRTQDDLNLNVCHFAQFNVAQFATVARGAVLGTRSTSWIHLSLDDRYRDASKPAVPFNGAHTLEGIAFDPPANLAQERDIHHWRTFTSSNGNVQPGHLQITSVRFGATQLQPGASLEVRVDVVNDGGTPIALSGPDNITYDENGAGWRDGACGQWRIGLDFDGRDGALVDHPYRFGVDDTLQPGATRTLGGFIRLNTPRSTAVWVGVVQECNHWEQDGTARTSVSVGNAGGGGGFSPDPQKIYRIISVNSGKGMDVEGARQDNGAIVHQWDYAGGQNQRWFFQDAGAGYYFIRAVHSGKCLDVRNVSFDSGAALQQWDCAGGDNQKWRLDVVEGAVVLVAKHSQKAVDVFGARQDNGAPLIQWDRHNGANQRWRIEEVQ